MIWSQCIRMFNVCGFFTCLWLVVCQFRCAECFCVLHPDQLFSQKQKWKVFILPCSLQPLLFWPRSSLQFKITLIIIRLHAGPVMVLIEQISITSIWTGGSSPPWTSLSSPFALSFFSPPSSSPLFFSLTLFSGRWFWWAPTVNLKCFCWDYKHWGGVPVVWEGGTVDTERRQRTVGLVGVL